MKKVRAARGDAQAFLTKAIRWKSKECLVWPYSSNGDSAMITVRHPTLGWRGGARTPVARLVCEIVRGHAPSPTHVAARTCSTPCCVSPHHYEWREWLEVVHSEKANAKAYRSKYPGRVREISIERDYSRQADYRKMPAIHFSHGTPDFSVDPEWDEPSWRECNP